MTTVQDTTKAVPVAKANGNATTDKAVSASFMKNIPEPARDDDGFIRVQRDLPIYDAETCGTVDLTGFVVRQKRMNATGPDGNPWSTFIVFTTKPTLALIGKDETPQKVEAGQYVSVAASTIIEAELADLANDPAKLTAVKIRPIKRIKTKNGFRMWQWEVSKHPETIARPKFLTLPSQVQVGALAQGRPVAALPAASVTEDGEVIE